MFSPAQQNTVDPLHAFTCGGHVRGSAAPIPLISTRFDVRIEAGLAIVETRRVFRNAEASSIEATFTFPVPVHAVLFGLTARIGERTLNARAQRKSEARETYESAIDRGKTSVLHEEILRGVHMLSVGHIPPETEIAVTSIWAMPLSFVGEQGHLRIPLTVGDIYGRSPLADSDDLVHAPKSNFAELKATCSESDVWLDGKQLGQETVSVPLNAPIDLRVSGWVPRALCGSTSDRRGVQLRVEPTHAGDAPIDVAILIDHSGSMGSQSMGVAHSATIHEAAVHGLSGAAGGLTADDAISLWEFDTRVSHVGDGDGSHLATLASRLSPPRGGTEIGGAITAVLRSTEASDVLLVTDGKSYELDIQEFARSGRRFTVVLVGEDSLEANVGHLAALSGGQVFIASDDDVADTIGAAIRSLRSPHDRHQPLDAMSTRISVRRAGVVVTAEWGGETSSSDEPLSQAVAAVAASLAIPRLGQAQAAEVAVSAGIVSHLTSLVLVDEAGDKQDGIPVARKVPLATPRAFEVFNASAAQVFPLAARSDGSPLHIGPERHSLRLGPDIRSDGFRSIAGDGLRQGTIDFDLSIIIDWDADPDALSRGDLSQLDRLTAAEIRVLAEHPAVIEIADELGISPIVAAIGLVAWTRRNESRAAARIARALVGSLPEDHIDAVSRATRGG